MSPEYHKIGRYDIAAHKACRKAGLTVEQLAGGALERWKAALEHYAACSDGCTCGDGWDHTLAIEALAGGKEEGR